MPNTASGTADLLRIIEVITLMLYLVGFKTSKRNHVVGKHTTHAHYFEKVCLCKSKDSSSYIPCVNFSANNVSQDIYCP